MFEPTLADVFHAVFGPDWRRRGPAVLGRSRRQICRWCSGESRMPRRALVLLQRYVTGRALPEIEARRVAGLRAIDEEAARRRAEVAGASTSLKLMLIRTDRQICCQGQLAPNPYAGA
jgi:hypothetical protein